jgi:hypothetical protein
MFLHVSDVSLDLDSVRQAVLQTLAHVAFSLQRRFVRIASDQKSIRNLLRLAVKVVLIVNAHCHNVTRVSSTAEIARGQRFNYLN